MAGGGSNDSKGIYEVNMTPLIDVSLVLVVILMVATPMALQSSIALQKAGAASAAAAPPAAATRIEVEVAADNSITVNGTAVAKEALRATLRPLVRDNPETPVVVACAGGATHGTFVYTLDEAKQAGAAQVAVVGGKHAP